MTGTSIEVISAKDSLCVYKINRAWKRDLRIGIYEQALKKSLRFPKNIDFLQIDHSMASKNLVVKADETGLKGWLQSGCLQVVSNPAPRNVLISGSGRCGTQALAHYLDGMRSKTGHPVQSRHETLHEFILPLLVEGNTDAVIDILRGMQHDIESAPYYALFPQTLSTYAAGTLIHLVRDGRRVVQSGLNRGWYANNSLWNQIKPVHSEDRFENCCHLWRVATENMSVFATDTFRLEDVIQSPHERDRLMALVGVNRSDKRLPHSNQGATDSDFSRWTPRQKSQFAAICGAMMDQYYPDWDD